MSLGLITANDLANIKGSGVSTRIVDNTRRRRIQPQGVVRLIYGFSKVGVFNRAVFIEAGDKENATDIFGQIDHDLERRGSWFHRALDEALDEGSVLALNLLKTNDSVDDLTGEPTPQADIAQYKAFSLSPVDTNATKKNKLYSSYFRKQRFWIPDEEYLLATRSTLDQGNIFNLVNLSQRKLTFFVKKSTISGFDITVKDWYADNVSAKPAFVKDGDLISDYFLDVYVVAGDFSNYTALSNDPKMSQFFDKNGLIASKLTQFLSIPEVSLVRLFQGSIIPNFKDKNDAPKAIDKIINSGTDYHGILCAIDKDQLDKFANGTNIKGLDLVGHSFVGASIPSAIDFLSYKRSFSKNSTFEMSYPSKFKSIQGTGVTITSNVGHILVTISNLNPNFATLVTNVETGTGFMGELTTAGLNAGIPYMTPTLYAYDVVSTSSLLTFKLTNDIKSEETSLTGSYVDIKEIVAPVAVTGASGSLAVATFPNDNVTVKVYVKTKTTVVLLATVPVATGETQQDLANGINIAINAGALSHGYTSIYDSNITNAITYSGADGRSHNGDTFITETIFNVSGQTAITFTTTPLSGGVESVGADYQYDDTMTGFYVNNNAYVVRKNDPLFLAWENGTVKTGDTIKVGSSTLYLSFVDTKDGDTFERFLDVSVYSDEDMSIQVTPPVGTQTSTFEGNPILTQEMVVFITSDTEISREFTASFVNQNTVRIPYAFVDSVKIGQYLEGEDIEGNPILVRITSVKNIGSPVPTEIEVSVDGVIKLKPSISGGNKVNRVLPMSTIFDRLQGFYLQGLEIKESHMPDNTNSRMKEILSVMTETPIRKTLVDPDMISFRYLVDTFNHGLETNSKNYIARLVRDRRKAIGLLNTPSTKEYMASVNPIFSDQPTPSNPLPIIKPEYIAKGGNVDANPDFLVTRPEESDGASYVAFFYPNVGALDSDSNPLSIPPAILVSNNFVRKWRDGNGFKATAGTNRGILTSANLNLIGVDHELDKEDRGWLEEAGINPLRMYDDGTIAIYGNQTGYHKFKSVLNQLNSRDTLITIETDVEAIMDANVFEDVFSDDIIRTTIVTSIQNYLNNLRDVSKAIKSSSVKFDRQNNPDWVVQENASIIDIEVELPYVTRKFVSRITLTGGSAVVGAFTAV